MNVIDTNYVLSDIYPIILSFNNTSKIFSSPFLTIKYGLHRHLKDSLGKNLR